MPINMDKWKKFQQGFNNAPITPPQPAPEQQLAPPIQDASDPMEDLKKKLRFAALKNILNSNTQN